MDDIRNLSLMIPKEIRSLGDNHQWLVKPFSTAGTRWTPPGAGNLSITNIGSDSTYVSHG